MISGRLSCSSGSRRVMGSCTRGGAIEQRVRNETERNGRSEQRGNASRGKLCTDQSSRAVLVVRARCGVERHLGRWRVGNGEIVLAQQVRLRQALQYGVHETRVAEVAKTLGAEGRWLVAVLGRRSLLLRAALDSP